MKALSLTQPWASLVALGQKTIETRSWPTSYRGELAIHASQAMPRYAREALEFEPIRTLLMRANYGWAGRIRGLPLGSIVAVAQLVACYPTEGIRVSQWWPKEEGDRERALGDYSPGRWAWVLRDTRPLPSPVPCRGALGLWTVEPEVEATVRAQLGEGVLA